MVRYSLDGLVERTVFTSQFGFLANMAVLKKTVNLALAVVLFIITVAVKISITRMCRSHFEQDNIMEATAPIEPAGSKEDEDITTSHTSRFRTCACCSGSTSRLPIPFRKRQRSFSRLDSVNENNLEEQLDDTLGQSGGTSGSTSLVQMHSPHPTWNDEPRHCSTVTEESLRASMAQEILGSTSRLPRAVPLTPIFESPARSPDVEHAERKRLICLRASGTGCWRWTDAKKLNRQMDAAHPFSIT
ncbi:hypothetical protein EDD17DRAFT_1653277 [Pisolithus thermaeus]|nr:hypothetical protein EV401DRAFT_1930629 [Pisolithus croceorrhizus]KAI6145318.1 hypothetical protein EDD17DRAFT_1653277 [Pisolithus thermaeus]